MVVLKSPLQNLRLYHKGYKGGAENDLHWDVFQKAQRFTEARRVLYPGCYRHLTTSLIFPDVTYVDYEKSVAPLYAVDDDDNAVRAYVNQHKVYDEDSSYRFYCCNVVTEHKKLEQILGNSPPFDLAISLSAGQIAEACTPFMSPTAGYLLVNDSHSDARLVHVNDNNGWELAAYWDGNDFTTDLLDRCFQSVAKKDNRKRQAVPLTKEQVQESIEVGTTRKRSFTMLLEPDFFLFRRV